MSEFVREDWKLKAQVVVRLRRENTNMLVSLSLYYVLALWTSDHQRGQIAEIYYSKVMVRFTVTNSYTNYRPNKLPLFRQPLRAGLTNVRTCSAEQGPPHMRKKSFFFLSQNCLLVKETAQNKLVESMYIRSFSLESRVAFMGALPQSPIIHRVS